MVSISRAEYDALKAQNAELSQKLDYLMEQVGLAKKRQFGSSSEKMQEDMMDQLGLTFNEAEAYAFGTKAATPEQVAVKAHARKRSSGSVEEIVPEGTPLEVVEHRLAAEERQCDVCGAEMVEIGKEIHRSLKMEPARFWIQEDATTLTPARPATRRTPKRRFGKLQDCLWYSPAALHLRRQLPTS